MSRIVDIVTTILALGLIVMGAVPLLQASHGLDVRSVTIDGTPATVFHDRAREPGPVVVIAHGFAGSQQLMQPFAISLARAGYVAVTFDFLGHGQHPRPLTGSVTEERGATAALVDQLDRVADTARDLPESDGRLALLGHSMASDIIVRYAQGHDDVAAVVAVSAFAPTIEAESPGNLLMIVGGWEGGLIDEAVRVASLGRDGAAEVATLYGAFDDASARKFVVAPQVEHIGVLYSATALTAAHDWLDAVFARTVEAEPDRRGAAIGFLFLGLILLARPLAHRLPIASDRPLGAAPPWRKLWLPLLLPMLLTPVIATQIPGGALPIAVADYLVVHFALYGLLTALGLWIAERGHSPLPAAHVGTGKLVTGATLLALYSIVVFGMPIHLYITSFWPTGDRVFYIAVMLLGTLPYFVADEWLTRGEKVPRGAYALSKLAFLISLSIAVAIDLERLFFLIIIVPVILVFFVIYGLFSGWAYRRTGHPLTGGVANAIAFAWAIAVTFPLIER